MDRIGIYGGTFNPPHVGHMAAAAYVREALALDRLLLIPNGTAPHKILPPGSPTGAQRLEMLTLAADKLDGVTVSDLELNRQGPSYTWETIALVREQWPQGELFLVMGTDMFLAFDSWREPQRILEQATLVVLSRGTGEERRTLDAQKARLEAMGGRVRLLENPVVEISSTQLRRLLQFRCAGPFLPEAVGDYIAREGLYATGENRKDLPMETLEQVVVALLNPNRVAHVLGCRDTAASLARIWGVDETDAARAGLLHDITKALDGPLQLTLCREYGIVLDDFSQKYPKTLHALTGSLVAQRIFGEKPEVVSAIRWHTTGRPAMTTLEKIIYIADYIEPNRVLPGVDTLRALAQTDLDGAVRLGLEMTLAHLNRQGSQVSPETAQALAYYTN